MPGLLRWDAFNQLERLEDETDQFGTSSILENGPGAKGLPQLSDLRRQPPGTFCTTVSWRARDVPNV
jgi:hypothetical protein